MFSDVVGSTRLWGKDPDAMSASLRLHDALFTATIARFGGHVFATAGDSFAAAFNRSSAGIECAGALQDALAGIDWGAGPALSVRIGLHAGEAEERGGNYFGRSVNLAARVMSVAHGGVSVCSPTVCAIPLGFVRRILVFTPCVISTRRFISISSASRSSHRCGALVSGWSRCRYRVHR